MLYWPGVHHCNHTLEYGLLSWLISPYLFLYKLPPYLTGVKFLGTKKAAPSGAAFSYR